MNQGQERNHVGEGALPRHLRLGLDSITTEKVYSELAENGEALTNFIENPGVYLSDHGVLMGETAQEFEGGLPAVANERYEFLMPAYVGAIKALVLAVFVAWAEAWGPDLEMGKVAAQQMAALQEEQ